MPRGEPTENNQKIEQVTTEGFIELISENPDLPLSIEGYTQRLKSEELIPVLTTVTNEFITKPTAGNRKGFAFASDDDGMHFFLRERNRWAGSGDRDEIGEGSTVLVIHPPSDGTLGVSDDAIEGELWLTVSNPDGHFEGSDYASLLLEIDDIRKRQAYSVTPKKDDEGNWEILVQSRKSAEPEEVEDRFIDLEKLISREPRGEYLNEYIEYLDQLIDTEKERVRTIEEFTRSGVNMEVVEPSIEMIESARDSTIGLIESIRELPVTHSVDMVNIEELIDLASQYQQYLAEGLSTEPWSYQYPSKDMEGCRLKLYKELQSVGNDISLGKNGREDLYELLLMIDSLDIRPYAVVRDGEGREIDLTILDSRVRPGGIIIQPPVSLRLSEGNFIENPRMLSDYVAGGIPRAEERTYYDLKEILKDGYFEDSSDLAAIAFLSGITSISLPVNCSNLEVASKPFLDREVYLSTQRLVYLQLKKALLEPESHQKIVSLLKNRQLELSNEYPEGIVYKPNLRMERITRFLQQWDTSYITDGIGIPTPKPGIGFEDAKIVGLRLRSSGDFRTDREARDAFRNGLLTEEELALLNIEENQAISLQEIQIEQLRKVLSGIGFDESEAEKFASVLIYGDDFENRDVARLRTEKMIGEIFDLLEGEDLDINISVKEVLRDIGSDGAQYVSTIYEAGIGDYRISDESLVAMIVDPMASRADLSRLPMTEIFSKEDDGRIVPMQRGDARTIRVKLNPESRRAIKIALLESVKGEVVDQGFVKELREQINDLKAEVVREIRDLPEDSQPREEDFEKSKAFNDQSKDFFTLLREKGLEDLFLAHASESGYEDVEQYQFLESSLFEATQPFLVDTVRLVKRVSETTRKETGNPADDPMFAFRVKQQINNSREEALRNAVKLEQTITAFLLKQLASSKITIGEISSIEYRDFYGGGLIPGLDGFQSGDEVLEEKVQYLSEEEKEQGITPIFIYSDYDGPEGDGKYLLVAMPKGGKYIINRRKIVDPVTDAIEFYGYSGFNSTKLNEPESTPLALQEKVVSLLGRYFWDNTVLPIEAEVVNEPVSNTHRAAEMISLTLEDTQTLSQIVEGEPSDNVIRWRYAVCALLLHGTDGIEQLSRLNIDEKKRMNILITLRKDMRTLFGSNSVSTVQLGIELDDSNGKLGIFPLADVEDLTILFKDLLFIIENYEKVVKFVEALNEYTDGEQPESNDIFCAFIRRREEFESFSVENILPSLI